MSRPDPDRLGGELRELRERSKLSQKRLGQLTGISPVRIGQIERGVDERGSRPRARPETLRMLARGLAAGGGGSVDERLAGNLYERLLVAAHYAEPAAEHPSPTGAPSDRRPAAVLDIERLEDELMRELLAVEPRQRTAISGALRAFVTALPNADR
jgi:transcriptional regulator with XRE-family HTH domain